jgi:hypothetical protein
MADGESLPRGAAVDGTDDFTNEAFKQFEERAEQLEFLKSELTNYTKM